MDRTTGRARSVFRPNGPGLPGGCVATITVIAWRREADTITILVIDDEIDVQLTFRVVLETAGYRVVGAESAEAALEQLEAIGPDLIVLDLVLPGMSGWEFLDVIGHREHPAVPLIVVSAIGDGDVHARAEAGGVSAVFEKPFTAERLRATVQDLIGPAPSRSSQQPPERATPDHHPNRFRGNA